MCGIAGIFSKVHHQSESIEKVKAMISVQKHRGPDDEGIWGSHTENHAIALGHNRLSIIDVSYDGHQPMIDNLLGNVIVFNGEVYNFKEIREELQKKGYSFKSKTDTEVILKSYAEWGVDCVQKLRGIFAFAIWDQKSRRLFVARDQMGVKPLYYFFDGQSFYFASEVRTLLCGGVPATISKEGLSSLMNYGSVQEPFTLISHVFSISPGSYIVIDSAFEVNEVNYWNPQFLNQTAISTQDAEEETKRLLMESVRLQLVSDVPLGAFLSGGIDSSAIVALMRLVNPDADLHTFSIIFDDPKYDEREYARMVAKKNHTIHTELLMSGNILKESLRTIIRAYDQPSMDGINSWCVSKLVKDSGITVALSGVGGDELFVGYSDFSKPRRIYKYAKELEILPHFLGNSLERVAWNEKLRKIGETVTFDYDPYFISRRVFSDRQYHSVVAGDLHTGFNQWIHAAYDSITSKSYIDEICKISWFDQRSYMLSTLLRDTDQMSMSHSLEIRVPLIDHRLVEFVTSLPQNVKMNASTPKHLLVKAAGEGLPEGCVYRKKQGFTFPFDTIIMTELKEEMNEFFEGGESSYIFQKSGLKKVWNDFQNERIAWSRVLLLYILDQWIKTNKVTA